MPRELTDEEKILTKLLRAKDSLPHLVLADKLEDNGLSATAKLIRHAMDPEDKTFPKKQFEKYKIRYTNPKNKPFVSVYHTSGPPLAKKSNLRKIYTTVTLRLPPSKEGGKHLHYTVAGEHEDVLPLIQELQNEGHVGSSGVPIEQPKKYSAKALHKELIKYKKQHINILSV